MRSPPRASLFRERDFRLLFVGRGVSAVGTAATYVALPLIAVSDLDAGPSEVGLIAAAGHAAWLVIGLPAGVFVDRCSPVGRVRTLAELSRPVGRVRE